MSVPPLDTFLVPWQPKLEPFTLSVRAQSRVMTSQSWSTVATRQFPLIARALLLCLLCSGTASALSLDNPLSELRHRAWGPKEGAPGDIVAMAQSSDGYLWIAGSGGLFRFDGIRFVHIDLSRGGHLKSTQTYNIYAPSSGGLWVGFIFGDAVFLKDGQITTSSEIDGLPPGSITSFAQDSSGTLWTGGADSLMRREGAKWRAMGAEDHYFAKTAPQLMIDSNDTLWVLANGKVMALRKRDKLFQDITVRERSSHGATPGVTGIAETVAGDIWYFSDQTIQLIQKNANPLRRIASSGIGIASDSDGAVWVTRADGKVQRFTHPEGLNRSELIYAQDPGDTFSAKEGLSSVSGYGVMLPDREGNVWVGTSSGLDRFSERNVSRFIPVLGPKEVFTPPRAAIAAGENGSLWVGGPTHVLWNFGAESPQHRDDVGTVQSALRADDGSLWFAGSTSVWRYAGGRLAATPLPSSSTPLYVQAMAQDASGSLWISIIRHGAFRLAGEGWVPKGGVADLSDKAPICMSTDLSGRLWFGYPQGAMAVLEGNHLTVLAAENRPPVGSVTAIYGKRGKVWVGGEFGLALLDGLKFRSVLPEADGILTTITGIVETPQGELWLNTSAGIVRVSREEVNRIASDPSHKIAAEVFSALDGVEGSGDRLRPLPTALQATDGRLWFTTNIGLYTIDPARIHRNALMPTVLVESLSANDKTYQPVTGLKLPQGSTAVRIDYVALSLTMAEKVRYRYKLEDVDAGWQDAYARTQAFYTNLSPGPHRFRVAAANNDGVWNDTGATLNFLIPPTFLQSRWFIALCLLSVAALVAAVVHLRLRQISTRMRMRFEERMAERERIARELHDTLLQGTQALILNVHAAANRIPTDQPVREMLDRTLERANRVMIEGRDRIQDLRIPTDTRVDLGESIAAVGAELSPTSSTAFSLVVEGEVRLLSPEVKQEAYQVAREALRNAFSHAHANSIEVQIIYGEDSFRLRVRDDGIGIDPKSMSAGVRQGHWGLKGMPERAQKIGGKVDVWSAPGAGTEIDLNVPAATAYMRFTPVRRWLLFLRALIGRTST
jgi:signal transduction histidine kinase/ligand-binding sensor domain-containing protein